MFLYFFSCTWYLVQLEKMLEILSIKKKNYQGLICDPRCYLSWRNFHVLLRKKWNMLFLDEMPYRYQLGPIGSMYHLKLCFLISFLSERSICVSQVLKSCTIIVLLSSSPLILVTICLMYCGASKLGAYMFIMVISSSGLIP